MTSKNYPNPAMRVPLLKKKPEGRKNTNGPVQKHKRVKKKK